MAASFIGLREVLLQGRWNEDREAVSGLAAAVIGGCSGLRAGPQVAARTAMVAFVGGCALHHAHRWWLYARIVNEWH